MNNVWNNFRNQIIFRIIYYTRSIYYCEANEGLYRQQHIQPKDDNCQASLKPFLRLWLQKKNVTNYRKMEIVLVVLIVKLDFDWLFWAQYTSNRISCTRKFCKKIICCLMFILPLFQCFYTLWCLQCSAYKQKHLIHRFS